MKNKIIKIISLIIFTLSLFTFVASALTVYTSETTNVITSNNLTMKLHDETTGGVAFPENGIHDIVPGQKIDKVVYVENTCKTGMWIRISLDNSIAIKTETGEETKLNIDALELNIDDKNWTKHTDGWYYYNKVLNPTEKTEALFTTVSLKETADNNYSNSEIKIVVNAQAVQSIHNKETVIDALGWPDTAIKEDTIISATSIPANIIANNSTKITFTGDEPSFTYEPENKDMFNGFKNIMPGDVIEQKIVVENKSKDKSVRLYLQANPISAEDKDFLSQMALAIYNGDDLISDDNASSQGSLSEKVYLGTIAPNSTIDLTAKLHCSITMNNDFASQEGKVNWVITAEEKEPTPTDLPQTGDNNKTIYVVMLLSCSLAVFTGTIFIKKRKDA